MKRLLLALLLGALAAQSTARAAEAPTGSRREVSLRGLVLLRHEPLLAPDVAALTTGVDATRLGAWDDPGLQTIAQDFVGRTIAQPMFEQLRARLSGFLRERFGLIVLVTLPPQEATSGVLQVVVTPSRIGEVQVTGERWFSERVYRDAVPALAPGNILDLLAIGAGVDEINANAYRRVELVLAPGAQAGTTDVTLQAQDRLPLRVFAGYNDTGTRSTSRNRVSSGIEWANALGRGDTATYQYSGDPQLERLRSQAFSYRAGLPNNQALTLSASSSRIDPALAAPFDQHGASDSLGLRYYLPLAPWGDLSRSLSFTADFKRSDNNLLFATIPISNNLTDIVQFGASYALSRNDARGSTTLVTTVVASPGGLSAKNHTENFTDSRSGARANYLYGSLEFSQTQRLPFGFEGRVNVRGQLSSSNLLGSEQLAFGGAGSVRGYEDGEVYADEGVLASFELRFPSFPGVAFFNPNVSDSLQPLVFVDSGWAHIHAPLVDEPANYHLISSGVGLRYQVSRYLSVNADYGWQLKALTGRARAERAHLSVSVSW